MAIGCADRPPLVRDSWMLKRALEGRRAGAILTPMAEPIRVSVDGVDDREARRLATARAREAAVLELYRIGQVTSGQAARELDISRVEFVDLANRRGIASIQTTADELEKELASLEP